LRKNPEVLLETLRKYQQQEQIKAQKAQQAAFQKFKTDPKFAIGQSPTYGTGPLLLVEFSDFQCPYCASARKTLKLFADKYPDRIKLVYRHFPLTQIHDEALPAAKAAWAAQQQGKFWEYHDALFDQQKSLNDATFISIAKTLGLDLAKFDRDRRSPQSAQAIESDQKLGESIGIEGTPFMIFNGEPLSGAVPVAELEKRLTAVK
jgi:protein-disulfide isomerase